MNGALTFYFHHSQQKLQVFKTKAVASRIIREQMLHKFCKWLLRLPAFLSSTLTFLKG